MVSRFAPRLFKAKLKLFGHQWYVRSSCGERHPKALTECLAEFQFLVRLRSLPMMQVSGKDVKTSFEQEVEQASGISAAAIADEDAVPFLYQPSFSNVGKEPLKHAVDDTKQFGIGDRSLDERGQRKTRSPRIILWMKNILKIEYNDLDGSNP
jgi:hypothetical protein